jgi:hypothetical protein
VESTKTHPKVEMTQVSASSATDARPSVSSTPHSTKASEMLAATKNTGGSMEPWRRTLLPSTPLRGEAGKELLIY